MSASLPMLFGSKTRAAVLRELASGWSGTVSELARRTDFSVRSVATEVRTLSGLRLLELQVVGTADVVRLGSTEAAKALARFLTVVETAVEEEDLKQVKESLVALGAPLSGVKAHPHFSPDETLVRALRLARRDGTLFRVLPVVFARNEGALNWTTLKEYARREKLRGELGVLVDLTGRAMGRPSLSTKVADLKDRRRTSPRYFPEPKSSFERTLAEEVSPPVAKEWGFFMNTTEESVRSSVQKHGG